MEEKLYFKPADYGKGTKKPKPKNQQTEQRVEKNATSNNHKTLKLICLLLFLLFLILIILYLLRGQTTTTGQYPANVKNKSLECISISLTYDKLGTVSPAPTETSLTITAIFSGEDSLNSLSLKNLLAFENNSEAVVAEARTHATFNIGLRTYNYGTEKFDNKFSIVSNKLLINLTVKGKEFDEFSKNYFMLGSSATTPSTLSDFQQAYESQGFTCRTNFDNNNPQQE